MNLKGITWSKRNQSQKDTYCIIYLTFSNDNMIVMEKRSVFVKGYGGGGLTIKDSVRESFTLIEPFCILIIVVVRQI